MGTMLGAETDVPVINLSGDEVEVEIEAARIDRAAEL